MSEIMRNCKSVYKPSKTVGQWCIKMLALCLFVLLPSLVCSSLFATTRDLASASNE